MGTSSQKIIVLKELVGNTPVQLDALQQFLLPFAWLIHDFWVSVWVMTLLVVLVKLAFEYREHRRKRE
jgi:hypothetical protein